MEVLGIWLSLIGLMYVAYQGFPVIVFAPIFAILAATLQGLPVLPSYTELFMGNAVTYIKAFFPVFLLGAVFGKVMEDTGLAKSIAHAIGEKVGHSNGLLAVVLACMVMTYGGISLFVVVFAVYPFAAELFLQQHSRWTRHPCRFDVVAISTDGDARLDWIKNAFDA